MWNALTCLMLFGITISICCPYIDFNSRRVKRCTGPECDLAGALSYCSLNGNTCNPGHEEVRGACRVPNGRCCRSICNGPESHCIAEGLPCDAGFIHKPGKCKVAGYSCCARP